MAQSLPATRRVAVTGPGCLSISVEIESGKVWAVSNQAFSWMVGLSLDDLFDECGRRGWTPVKHGYWRAPRDNRRPRAIGGGRGHRRLAHRRRPWPTCPPRGATVDKH